MTWVVGNSGPDIRADVEVTVRSATEFSYEFVSNCSPLYDDAIRQQIESIAAEFHHPKLHLSCLDSGALPMTWKARLTAAFCLAMNQPLPPVVSERQYESPGIRRTRLYVPANTPKLIPNAALFAPDAVILDLEESVHSERKFEALAMAAAASESLDWSGTELMVRTNPGPLGESELRALARSSVATFILPKIDDCSDVLKSINILDELGSGAKVIPLIESALGVENAFQIASCSDRITAISLGLEDYVADIGATRSTDQSESTFARSRVLNAARAAGIMPLASVFPGYHDLSEVESYARSARLAGYEGIGCIHPNQIEPAHRGFRATDEELNRARKIVEAYKSTENSGAGAVGVEGSMADLPTYRRALRLIKQSAGGTGE